MCVDDHDIDRQIVPVFDARGDNIRLTRKDQVRSNSRQILL
jgi:hypothetical protein